MAAGLCGYSIHGANLNLDAGGSVDLVIDAHSILALYRAMCAGLGFEGPPVIVCA